MGSKPIKSSEKRMIEVLVCVASATAVFLAFAPRRREQKRRRLLTFNSDSLTLHIAMSLALAVAIGTKLGAFLASGSLIFLQVVVPWIRRRAESSQRIASPAQIRQFVDHFTTGISAGLSVVESLNLSGELAPPGLASDVHHAVESMQLGTTLNQAIGELVVKQPHCRMFGDVLKRTFVSGAPIVATLDSLSEFTQQAVTSEVTRRIRSVGVKAVLPLGLCFLPAFILVSVVPIVFELMRNL